MKTLCTWLQFGSAKVLTALLALTVFGPLAASPSDAQSPGYALSVSTSSNHSGAKALPGATLTGNAYVFTSPAGSPQNYDPSGIAKVCYWLDTPSMTGTATHCESYMPYDFISSVNNTTTSPGNPWNTTQVANGAHTITQAVTTSAGGTEVDTAAFTVQNATLSLSATSLAFGSQLVGTPSAAKTVTLTNSGTAPVTFTGVTTTGDYAVSSNTCGALPTKGAPCTISVTFTPTATGSRAGTLTITDTATTSPQRVSLSGTGAASLVSLAVTPTNYSIALGTQQQFTATGTLSNGSKQNMTTAVSWSSSAAGVATISNTSGNQGLASSVATGSTTIKAVSGSVSGSTTLTVQAAQPTITFSANPTTVPQGQPSTLTWTTTNATSVSIDNGIGAVAASGSTNVSPAATTTYTLTATGSGGTAANKAVTVSVGTSAVQHYEYVLPDQNLYVYDLDNNFQLVKHVSIPQVQGTRGVGAVLGTHMLYISFGTNGNKSVSVPGTLLAYDLLTDTVVWTKSYNFGVDSFAITPDGSTIYMPVGVNSGNATWHIIDAATGNAHPESINTGWNGAHDTVVSLDGAHVFMGPHLSPELIEGSTSTNSVVRDIGPLKSGVGPFTLNGKDTLAFTTATGFFGFQVSDTTTGTVLYTVPVSGFSIPPGFAIDTPDHGISLSPDEKEIYLIDTANAYAHVFDVSGLPSKAPTQVADVPLTTSFTGNQSPCLYECTREGWIRHTRDGQYVLVGDSGNVISTSTRQVIATLPQLYNTRVFVEIDWQNGLPISTTTREGRGYVTK